MRLLLLLLCFTYVTAFPAVGEDYNKMMEKRTADDMKAESERWKLLAEQLKPLAESGDVNAQYTLGEYFHWYKSWSLGFSKSKIAADPVKDEAEALKWYGKAAEQGHSKAQIAVGDFYNSRYATQMWDYYKKGSRTPFISKDSDEAFKWYRKAADQGEPVAQYKLGNIYIGYSNNTLNPEKDKVMVQTNRIEAYAYFKLASVTIISASSSLNSLKKDISKSAIALGEKRAKELSSQYIKSFTLSADELALLKNSAEGGDANSQQRLGFLYHSGYGLPQVPQDYAQAAKWYRKAADQGNPHAQYYLGLLYILGLGVPVDKVEGYAYCRLGMRSINGFYGLRNFIGNGWSSQGGASYYNSDFRALLSDKERLAVSLRWREMLKGLKEASATNVQIPEGK